MPLLHLHVLDAGGVGLVDLPEGGVGFLVVEGRGLS